MGLRFRRSVKLFPGVRLNVTKTGVSTTIGPRGAHTTISSRRVTSTVGVPGSGLSYSEMTSVPPAGRSDLRRSTGKWMAVLLLLVCASAVWLLAACQSPALITAQSTTVEIGESKGGGSVTLVSQGPIYYPPLACKFSVSGKVLVDVTLDDMAHLLAVVIYSRDVSPARVQDSSGAFIDTTKIFDDVTLASYRNSTWRFDRHVATGRPTVFRVPVSFKPGQCAAT